MKRIKMILLFALTVICVFAAAGCKSDTKEQEDKLPEKTYAFIPKDLQNSYMLKMYTGFQKACAEIGAHAVYCPPSSATADMQAEVIDRLVEQGVV